MKFIKSLILLIVAIVAISNAADTATTTKYTGFKVKSLTPANPCNASPSEISVSTCTNACGSLLNILPVENSNTQFNFQIYAADDTKCAKVETSKVPFTCADGTTSIKINDDLSLVCVVEKESSSDSSDASSIVSSLLLLYVSLAASMVL